MGAVSRPFASRATDSVLKTSGTNGRRCDGRLQNVTRGNRLGRSANQIAPSECIQRLRSRSGLGCVKAKSPLQWQYLFLHFACSNSCFEVVSTQNETGKRFEKRFNGLWTSSGSGITMTRSRKNTAISIITESNGIAVTDQNPWLVLLLRAASYF